MTIFFPLAWLPSDADLWLRARFKNWYLQFPDLWLALDLGCRHRFVATLLEIDSDEIPDQWGQWWEVED